MTSTMAPERPLALSPLNERIQRYWDEHIHDLAVVKHPVGSLGFFNDLEEYRFDKLRYLPRVVNFSAFRDKDVLEIGCGAGVDAVLFARGGARVTGVDLSRTAVDLAKKNFALRQLPGTFRVADGEHLPFADGSFDAVYAHGVLQYTGDAERLLQEAKRVLKPGGQAIFMVYNRLSWLNGLSQLLRVELEHEDAPVLNKYSPAEFRRMLSLFPQVRLVVERFPVKSRLHRGVKGLLYNTFFVGAFNALPQRWVRRFGWHLMAFTEK